MNRMQTGVPTAAAQAALTLANAKAQATYSAAIASGTKPASALSTLHKSLTASQLTYAAATNKATFQAKAQNALNLATKKAYADLSKQQITLSENLGAMASAWQDLKARETPVVAGALAPWLRDISDLTGKLAPIITWSTTRSAAVN